MLTRQLLERGLDHADIFRLSRSGVIERVRRGAYAPPADAEPSTDERHRRLVLATAPQLRDGAVISHGSAALLHGLPVFAPAVERVHVTRSRSTGAKSRTLVEVHGAPMRLDDITVLDGVPVTTMARTVADLGRTESFDQAVAAGDQAVAAGLSRDELDLVLASMRRWPGVRAGRRAAAFLDPRSESPGESLSRIRFLEAGLPMPEPQYLVRDRRGNVVARCDFGWEEQRTLGEFDGRIKYGRLLKEGQRIEDVLYAEKTREDLLRDLGWQVVRWIWADLYRPYVIRDRVLRAFARSAA